MNNPIEKIQSYYDELTKTDKEIAIYLINNPWDAATKALDEIAKRTNTSKSAMSRFAQRIGYSGYTEFKYEMARYMASGSARSEEETVSEPLKLITRTYADYILKMGETLDKNQLERIAGLFLSSENVKILGINRSYNSANQLKQRLIRIGFSNVSSEGDSGELNDLLLSAKKKDMFIIISTTDNTKFYASRLKDVKAKIVFITANPSLPLKKYCDEYIVVPRISRDSYASFLDDQAIFFVLNEILIEVIARKAELVRKND